MNDTHISVVKLVRWLVPYAKRRWQGLLGLASVMLLSTGVSVLKPWPMKVLVDYVLGGNSMTAPVTRIVSLLPGATTREGLLSWTVGGTIGLFLLNWILGVANSLVAIRLGKRMSFDLARELFAHMQRLSLKFHARKPVGDSIRRVVSDSACVSVIIKDAVLPALAAMFTLVSMFAVMWELQPRLTVVSLGVMPLMVLALRQYAGPMQELSYQQHEVEGRQYEIVEQTLSSIPVVQAFAREEDAERRFRETTRATVQATLALNVVGLKFKILIGLATAAGTATILWMGAQRVTSGELTVGTVLVFLSYLGSFYEPIASLMYTPATIHGAAGSARRVMEVLEAEPEVRDQSGARPLAAIRGHLRLEQVTFGYERDRPILQDVTIEARPGDTVALVGATGAGKSTLVGLIPRFYDPWSGRVTIDGNDIKHIELKSLRSQVGIVLQDPFLFPLSIAENIAYGRPDANRAEIEQAAVDANAHEFISQLSDGYDSVVGERGATLSGGQRQRLSIARALLKDAPILILDEPTSALDAETEGLLLQALERLMKGRTTFIIAHRLSTIRNASKIVVLQDGRIVEQGTHQELIAKGGVFARLSIVQAGAPESDKVVVAAP